MSVSNLNGLIKDYPKETGSRNNLPEERGICRNRVYQIDEKTLDYVCDKCGMFSRREAELLKFHYWKIKDGKLVSLPLPAEKIKKITEVT